MGVGSVQACLSSVKDMLLPSTKPAPGLPALPSDFMSALLG